MKTTPLLIAFFMAIGLVPLKAQDAVQVHLEDDGILQLDLSGTTETPSSVTYTRSLEWIQDHLSDLNGKLIQHNSATGEILFKGKKTVALSEKTSVFQTQMFFTLRIRTSDQGYRIRCTDIYYRSLPEYGKQGIPSLLTYTSDWMRKDRLYRKNGKIRWLNQYYRDNSISAAKELLANLSKRY